MKQTIFLLLLITLTAQAQTPKVIDTHNHLQGGRSFDFQGAATTALEEMKQSGVDLCFLMPPPQSPRQKGSYRVEDLMSTVNDQRLRFLGGGGSLNVMIQKAVESGQVSPRLRQHFRNRANHLIELGVVGFGEMAAEHFSLNSTHPYISAPPDHELFLELADIAARAGLPIDLHMEITAEHLRLPDSYSTPPNPELLQPNLAAFERLLSHNRDAIIAWDHCGWDNTGHRTPELTRQLLQDHSNLRISLRRFVRRPKEKSRQGSDLVHNDGTLRQEWKQVFLDYPDRFLLGSDEFYLSPTIPQPFHPSTGSTELTVDILTQLPRSVAEKIGGGNAEDIYAL
jgi:hypothetical protein